MGVGAADGEAGGGGEGAQQGEVGEADGWGAGAVAGFLGGDEEDAAAGPYVGDVGAEEFFGLFVVEVLEDVGDEEGVEGAGSGVRAGEEGVGGVGGQAAGAAAGDGVGVVVDADAAGGAAGEGGAVAAADFQDAGGSDAP